MSYQAHIKDTEYKFNLTDSVSILESAISQGINLPYGCRNGDCGGCKCNVSSGVLIDNDGHTIESLTDVLLCQSFANSDIVLDIPGFDNSIKIRNYLAKIIKLDKHNNTAIMQIQIPNTQTFNHLPGQFIEINAAGVTRSYSIANIANDNKIIELHIRHYLNGFFSSKVWNDYKVGSVIKFKAPLGNFTLQSTQNPLLMVCTGTGFAPINSLLQHMLQIGSTRSVHLIWGNYEEDDFYCLDYLEQYKKLNLKLSLCANKVQDATTFSSLLVTQVISQEYNDLSNYEVYACGNPNMINDIRNLTTNELNLNKNNFFCDSFN
ncbi:MAG: 2Fe-2S iron-sulfur cluster binding domain-containing protein [Neisseriaceae bacterium]|nr:MAG: 2Fe-2S iron-sulfur cluster binding domain-containing protein [Neisseriaceae bacterium]